MSDDDDDILLPIPIPPEILLPVPMPPELEGIDPDTCSAEDVDRVFNYLNDRFKVHRLDENHNVVECTMFEAMDSMVGDRAVDVVAQDQLTDDIYVSTVFLGRLMFVAADDTTPHGRLFETMIMGGPYDGHQIRAMTWDEAVHIHEAAKILALTGTPKEIRQEGEPDE